MTEDLQIAVVRQRVRAVFMAQFGKVTENLVGSGLVDSLRAIDVALTLEEEFGIPLEDLSVKDMSTLSTLSEKVHAIASRRADQGACR